MISETGVITGKLNNAIKYIEPKTQEKIVEPSKQEQIIVADEDYNSLSKVTVKKIPDTYIVTAGDITITENGTYDVKEKENAIVNVPVKVLGTKTITENGTYNASDDNLDGYSQVEVNTSGVDINEYFYDKKIPQGYDANPGWSKLIKYMPGPLTLESGANANYLFKFYAGKMLPTLNVTGTTSCVEMFYYCENLIEIPFIDTSNAKNVNRMFYCCENLLSIPKLDFSSVNITGEMTFYSCKKLKNLGGFENLGMSYDTTNAANSFNNKLVLSDSYNLTHESLMNVINNLYDIATKGCNAQQLILGSRNLAKLTSEEIAIATTKGWTVS